MLRVLAVLASPRGERSISRACVDVLRTTLEDMGLRTSFRIRDLYAPLVPHITNEWVRASSVGVSDRDLQATEVLGLSLELIGELRDVDLVVMSAPIHNFGVPSVLKAYLDHVALLGETFVKEGDARYIQQCVGLLGGKRCLLIAAAGFENAPPLHSNLAIEVALSGVVGVLEFLGIGLFRPCVCAGTGGMTSARPVLKDDWKEKLRCSSLEIVEYFQRNPVATDSGSGA